jgi:hypothetical protein
LAVLSHSQDFKQVCLVADCEWMLEEESKLRPDYELTLDDEEHVAAWAPVRNTLGGFQRGYDEFLTCIRERGRSVGA